VAYMSSPRAEANTIEAPLDVARIIVCSCFSLFLFLFLVSGSLIIHSFFAFDFISLSFELNLSIVNCSSLFSHRKLQS